MLKRKTRQALYKILVFCICLLPFIALLFDTINNQLGANPIETLHFSLGDWALRFLCLSLAMTPIKLVTGISWPLRYRRMLGLYSFFYALLHFLVYIVLDLSLSWQQLMDEVPKSPYIIVGLLTFLILTILTITSTKKSQKRLGKNWKRLHSLVYIAALGAVIHFFWLVKSDYQEPIIYALILSALMLVRLAYKFKKNKIPRTGVHLSNS